MATIDTGRELGVAVPLMGAELGSHVTQCARAEAYLSTKWHLDQSSRFATIDMGAKAPLHDRLGLRPSTGAFWKRPLHRPRCPRGKSLCRLCQFQYIGNALDVSLLLHDTCFDVWAKPFIMTHNRRPSSRARMRLASFCISAI